MAFAVRFVAKSGHGEPCVSLGVEASDFTFISIILSLLEPYMNMCRFVATAINFFLHLSNAFYCFSDFLLSNSLLRQVNNAAGYGW